MNGFHPSSFKSTFSKGKHNSNETAFVHGSRKGLSKRSGHLLSTTC